MVKKPKDRFSQDKANIQNQGITRKFYRKSWSRCTLVQMMGLSICAKN